MQATDENFYGTNNLGGRFDFGVLYHITLGGQFTVLHDFEGNTGTSPQGTLLQHTNGILYGTRLCTRREQECGLACCHSGNEMFPRVERERVLRGENSHDLRHNT